MLGEVGEEEFGEVLEGDAVVAGHFFVEAVGEVQEAGEGGGDCVVGVVGQGGAAWFAGEALTPALSRSRERGEEWVRRTGWFQSRGRVSRKLPLLAIRSQ